MSIVTLQQAKRQLRIALDDTSYDDEVQGYVDAVTGAVEDYKGLVIEERQLTHEVQVGGVTTLMLPGVPVISLDTVATVDGATTWDVANLHVHGPSGTITVLSGPPLAGLLAIGYTAGFTTVPPRFVQGALVVLQHVWETQRGVGTVRTGVVGSEEGYDPRTSYSIPRKALEWLGPPLAGVA